MRGPPAQGPEPDASVNPGLRREPRPAGRMWRPDALAPPEVPSKPKFPEHVFFAILFGWLLVFWNLRPPPQPCLAPPPCG